jgi:CBS domain-containing protein
MAAPINAQKIMTSKLTTLRPETDVFDAIDRLLSKGISGAPVVDDDGKLVGILSELDCINRLVQAAHDAEPTGSVGAFMSRTLRTVGPQTDLLTIAHIFVSEHIRRLPVIDDAGKLLGQISRRDLLRAFNDLVHAGPKREPKLLYLSALFERTEHPISR